MSVESVKQGLEQTLNQSVFSGDSVYGILIVILIVFLLIRSIHKMTNFVLSLCGFLLLLQVMHWVSMNTPVGTWAPVLQSVFKYDVFTALAQLFVGTPVADGLLWLQAWLNTVLAAVAGWVLYLVQLVKI